MIDIDSYQGLASDRRAYRVGDPLVILISESTRAQSSAGTGTTKSTGIDMGAYDTINQPSIGLSIEREGKGKGHTVRNGSAKATVSVQIIEVLDNGLVALEGRQNLIINNEKQMVILTGIARIDDITKDNTLSSTRVANAEIEIQGKGIVSSANHEGVFMKLLRWMRLF
ncbi:flagellar basal body L-ring protein FlgH [Teredinibacter sp. KSP-S5-2]|uniref:flagellar basal body L-ring protein FlgH n=1 Tax=Teredinibacter sp. KSP-S5-2 TaxID=3034506 RepID=UPI002934B9EE|nr:flagellar basal body L-ring protein FlgH [Teredinibacter sp. KSP-S5-2]WNO11345.1 flagellar basal body L-ring protein FlgH [Teredinibacter sp. KSP-S5-2]